MIRFVPSIYLLLHFGFSSIAIAEPIQENNLNISYSYGMNQLTPSLISNSKLDFDRDKMYSDFWIQGGFKISDRISFAGALELTDQPHELIGTKFSRPDFPLSTGRFQQSVVKYANDKLSIQVGRDDMLGNPLRPAIFNYPLFADGLGWDYKWHRWSFRHVYQVLPSESHADQVYRRSVSYHHLSKSFKNLSFGAGEYFILAGDNLGLDFKRLNPFLPYSLNSHDSVADYYSGFSGDSDNSLIKLFLEWSKKSTQVAINLYIDEFQIDGVDRDVLSDAMLLSFSAVNEIMALGQNNLLKWGFSLANPNFGQHPGPFTTTTIGAYPLFEYSPGMKNLVYFDATLFTDKLYQLSFSGYSEKWVKISQLSPDRMNYLVELDQLDVYSDYRLSVGAKYKLQKLPLRIGIDAWMGSEEEYSSGLSLYFQYDAKRLFKP
ncbi:MAG: hypothetical protein HN633_05635 [Candidatus Marinimicrobia bacterium]|nr:hypothetical protein [Candidatus Neomarinimicrobiota bacterium]